MKSDEIRVATAKQNLETAQIIKRLSLNMLEKWRKLRESQDYALRYKLRPKLKGGF